MNSKLTASQVRTFTCSPRKYFFDTHVAPSASVKLGQEVHEELSKYLKTHVRDGSTA